MLNKAAVPQPEPKEGEKKVYPLVIADLEARREVGIKTYGTELMTDNGRKPLWDAYQEALDLAVYLRQAIYELYGE